MKLLPLLALLLMPLVVQAQFTYATNDDAITITGYTGVGGTVVIPNNINGYTVANIGNWAFYATSVTNVLVPDNITTIGDGAFFDCESLTNVTLGNGVINVGDWAFGFCPTLASICFRGNAPGLGGSNVFYNDQATVYYLPGATGWGLSFDSHPAILWNPPVPFNYTTNTDGLTLTITGYTGYDADISIPRIINFLPVTCIGDFAFCAEYGLTNVQIPSGVVTIGEDAFYKCYNLVSVTIPDGMTNIEDSAFSNCWPLTGVTIPNSLISIGDHAFDTCFSLNNIIIPNNVTCQGSFAFNNCISLTAIAIPNGITCIGECLFDGCSSLTNVTIPFSVTSIGDVAFAGCTSLTNISIPDTVTSIGSEAFDGSGLIDITIPDSVTSLGEFAFYDCYYLNEVTIPSSITSLGDFTFYNAPVTGIFFKGNAPILSEYALEGSDAVIYYLPGTTGWNTIFAGYSTALWFLPNPTILGFEPNFGIQTNSFGFTISWATNSSVVVEACTNLANSKWLPVQTNTLTDDTVYFSDPQWANYPSRFYRIQSP